VHFVSEAWVSLSSFSGDKRHYRDHSSAFYCYGQFPLMAGAITGYSTRHNLASLGNKIIENSRIFVINLYIGIRAKAAEFLSMKKLFLGISIWSISVWYCHCLFPLR
jgi:hypothetical protein